MRRETQDSVECRHWVEPSVEAEHLFVEVRLSMLLTHSVMDPKQPCLQVREGEVDHRQVSVRSLGSTLAPPGFVRIAHRRQRLVALPASGAHNSALGHRRMHEPCERVLAQRVGTRLSGHLPAPTALVGFLPSALVCRGRTLTAPTTVA